MYLAGTPAYVMISVGTLNLVYQFWVHTQHVDRLGILDYWLVTPSNHRVHHAKTLAILIRTTVDFSLFGIDCLVPFVMSERTKTDLWHHTDCAPGIRCGECQCLVAYASTGGEGTPVAR